MDNIIDVMFAAAKDVGASTVDDAPPEPGSIAEELEDVTYKQEHTPKSILDHVRDSAIVALSQREATPLIAHKRAQFWSGDKTVRAVCPVSKKYKTGYYWYAFHPHQEAFLSEAVRGFLLLGCVDSDVAYALPFSLVKGLLPHLNTTVNDDRTYWHIHLQPMDSGGYQLLVPKKLEKLNLQEYALKNAGA